jgi:hypothetical protein
VGSYFVSGGTEVKTTIHRFDGDWLVIDRDGFWHVCGNPLRALVCWWRAVKRK